MINDINPIEFVTMIPESLSLQLNEVGITDVIVMEVCSYLNAIRNGGSGTIKLCDQELDRIVVTGCRLNLSSGDSRLMKKGDRLLEIKEDWVLYLTGGGSNFIESDRGLVTWTICKDEGKRYPKAYKLFMKYLFSNFNNTMINKIDLFYDCYIRNYNEIYAKHYLVESV